MKVDVSRLRFEIDEFEVELAPVSSAIAMSKRYIMRLRFHVKLAPEFTTPTSLTWHVHGVHELTKENVRAAIIAAFTHELDECLWIDGERAASDPHPEIKKNA